jgi:hypothetical protein
MGSRIIKMSGELLVKMCQTRPDGGISHVLSFSALPWDTRLEGVYADFDTRTVSLMVASSQFPDVEEGQRIPSMDILFTTHYCEKDSGHD